MFCKNCGNNMASNADICVKCGYKAGTGDNYCYECGNEVRSGATVCLHCGVSTAKKGSRIGKAKSKVAAGLFGIFLGTFGVHNFYLGYKTKAIIQLLIVLFTCGAGAVITSIWGLVEGILILCGGIDKDGQGYLIE